MVAFRKIAYNLTPVPTAIGSVFKGYRFGFNGKEKDNEINVNCGYYPMAIGIRARVYDRRLGRCLSLNPLMAEYPFLSAYCGMGNTPTCLIDGDGREIINPYIKITQEAYYFIIQRAIEIVKLTLLELYAIFNNDATIKIEIFINYELSPEYKEPSMLEGFPCTTSYSNEEEFSTHTIEKAHFKIYESKLVTKKEVVNGIEITNFYRKVAKTNPDGTKIRDDENKTICNEIPISLTEANTTVTISPKIRIDLAKGIVSTQLLGGVLTHELGHVNFVITNPALTLADKNLGTGENENAAVAKEAEYTKVYKSSNDKKADAIAN